MDFQYELGLKLVGERLIKFCIEKKGVHWVDHRTPVFTAVR